MEIENVQKIIFHIRDLDARKEQRETDVKKIKMLVKIIKYLKSFSLYSKN